jgi:hypothetical protein
MRQEKIDIYTFEDICKNPELLGKVLNNYSNINVDFDWWQDIYEDAKDIGLKLDGFNLDRKEINGSFLLSANEVAQNIISNHGSECDTYNTALNFLELWQPVFAKYMETEEGEDILIELEDDFLSTLLNDYFIILENEYSYLTSEVSIVETLQCNEYEYTVNGKIY